MKIHPPVKLANFGVCDKLYADVVGAYEDEFVHIDNFSEDFSAEVQDIVEGDGGFSVQERHEIDEIVSFCKENQVVMIRVYKLSEAHDD